MKTNINIKITGPLGSGKSTVAAIISKALKNYDFDVTIKSTDFNNENYIVSKYMDALDVTIYEGNTKSTVSIDSVACS